MKKIIDGKVYNTKTAEEISCDSFSTPGDFHYYCETLHRTKNGNYFFHGTGGAMSHYAQSLGNNTTGGGSRIWIVSEEKAVDWLAKNDPEKALELFPDHFEEA